MRKIARKPTVLRHSTHAEWGHGIVVEETPEKLYVAFEKGGLRPFMNEPRFRELLVKVELSTAEVATLTARLEKLVPELAGKPKPKKKAAPKAAPASK